MAKARKAKAKRKKLSLTVKVFIVIAIILASATIVSGIPGAAQFFAARTPIPAPIPGPLPTALDLQNYPFPFVESRVYNSIIVVGADAPAKDVTSAINIAASLDPVIDTPPGIPIAKLDTEITQNDKITKHLILVGGVGVNRLIAEVDGVPYVFDPNYKNPGVEDIPGILILKQSPFNPNLAVLEVCGNAPIKTELAANALANFQNQGLAGIKCELEPGTMTCSDNVPPEELKCPSVKNVIPVSQCQELTQGGATYVLTIDIDESSRPVGLFGFQCFNFKASNIEFDCQNHTVLGPYFPQSQNDPSGLSSAFYLEGSKNNNQIRNCNVQNWGQGVFMLAGEEPSGIGVETRSPKGNTVANNVFTDNGFSIQVTGGATSCAGEPSGNTVTNNNFFSSKNFYRHAGSITFNPRCPAAATFDSNCWDDYSSGDVIPYGTFNQGKKATITPDRAADSNPRLCAGPPIPRPFHSFYKGETKDFTNHTITLVNVGSGCPSGSVTINVDGFEETIPTGASPRTVNGVTITVIDTADEVSGAHDSLNFAILDLVGVGPLVGGTIPTRPANPPFGLQLGETVNYNGHDITLRQVIPTNFCPIAVSTFEVDGVTGNVNLGCNIINKIEICPIDDAAAVPILLGTRYVIFNASTSLWIVDGDEFYCEDPDDPDWVWNLENLQTGNPIFGIEFDQNWDTPSDAIQLGDCIRVPTTTSYARVCFDSLSGSVADVSVRDQNNNIIVSGSVAVGSPISGALGTFVQLDANTRLNIGLGPGSPPRIEQLSDGNVYLTVIRDSLKANYNFGGPINPPRTINFLGYDVQIDSTTAASFFTTDLPACGETFAPDLTVASITFDNNNPRVGDSILVSADYCNIGNDVARNVRISMNETTEGNLALNNFPEDLQPGECKTIGWGWFAFNTAGTHTFIAFVDPFSDIGEFPDGTNNQLSRDLQVSTLGPPGQQQLQ